MKLGFFYSGTIMIDKNQRKYGVAYTDKLFTRYLQFSDEIEVCMRVKEIDDASNFSEITLPNIRINEIPNLSSISGLLNTGKATEAIDSIVSACDCIIIRIPSDIAAIVAKSCEKNNKPYLLEMVGCAFDAYWFHSLKGKLVAVPNYLKTKAIVKNAPNVIYVTERFLENRYPTKGNWIACSDVELIESEENLLEKRIDHIEQERAEIIIGSMGAVNIKYKGQDRVIKALGLLKKQGFCNYRYQIVGNGDQSYLRSIVEKTNTEDVVEFLGGLPHKDIFKWLDNVDIYIQPSMTEGLPRSVVEAMSRGVLCIGSNVGGMPELINEAFLFPNVKEAHYKVMDILMSIKREDYYREAERNIHKSEDFKEALLERKRQAFYKEVFGNIIV